jgi:hypothetical protein
MRPLLVGPFGFQINRYSMSPESGHRLRDKDMRKNKELKRGERI